MLFVKTKIGTSGIHGIGLFADQFIPKGTVTWKYSEEFDVGFSAQEMASFPKITQEYLNFYSYFDTNLQNFILCSDNQKFINHSQDPGKRNIESTVTTDTASRDILPGEELLCDYFKFDKDYFARHGISEDKLI